MSSDAIGEFRRLSQTLSRIRVDMIVFWGERGGGDMID